MHNTNSGVEKVDLCSLPEEYNYSSTRFYETGIDNPSVNSGQFSFALRIRPLVRPPHKAMQNTNSGVETNSDFAVDLGVNVFKTGMKETFNTLGGENVLRNEALDIFAGMYKSQVKIMLQ